MRTGDLGFISENMIVINCYKCIFRKSVDGKVELELDLRNAVDVVRSDGKLASIHVSNDYEVYFVIWHDRFPEHWQ